MVNPSLPNLPSPWGQELWQHLHDEHGLILSEEELADIISKASPLEEARADALAYRLRTIEARNYDLRKKQEELARNLYIYL